MAQRLRVARTDAGFSQGHLAMKMGISRDQLASVETGRARLRFWPAWRACFELNINPSWLAAGKVDKSPFVFFGFEPKEKDAITERTPFSEGFSMIGNYYEAEWAEAAAHVRAGRGLAINSAEGEQATLDTITERDSPSLMSRWDRLRERVKIVARPYGAKSRIARDLGVTRQAVDQWIKRSTAPTADTTLRLLEWVAAEEAQQKSAGSVEARPARKDPNEEIQT